MGLIRRIVFLVVVALPVSGQCQTLSLIKDLKPDALKFVEGEYVDANGGALQTFYFRIEPSEYAGNFLQIKASRNFTLFINGQLAASDQKEDTYSIDSLRQQFGSPQLLIGFHQREANRDFAINIVSSSKAPDQAGAQPKPRSSFRDFAIMAILILLTFFISLLRLNPKLTSDYFSVAKIFSLRETDDSQIHSRITSSSNILFYVFCSLMAGFCLTLIFEFTSVGNGTLRVGNFWLSIFQWLKMSLVILSLFFLKIIVVYSLSLLFGIKGVGGVHFFYWIRVLLITASLVTIILFLYFISRGQNIIIYQTVLWIVTTVLILIMILVFLKLMRKAECSIFHLFSYICATELIPFLITIKLLHQ